MYIGEELRRGIITPVPVTLPSEPAPAEPIAVPLETPADVPALVPA